MTNKLKIIFLFPVLLIALLAFGARLKVSRTECYTKDGICPPDIAADVNQLVGSSILMPTSREFKNSLLRKHRLKSVHIARRLPHTLIARVELSPVLGNLSTDIAGSVSVVVNLDGQVVASQKVSHLPTLLVSSPHGRITAATAEMLLGLSLLNTLQGIVQVPPVGEIDGTSLIASYPNGPKIIIDMTSNETSWIGPLQAILARSRISSSKPKKIDLRFANPVLIYH